LFFENQKDADVTLSRARRQHDDSPALRALPRLARLALVRPRLACRPELERQFLVLPRAVLVLDLVPDERPNHVRVEECRRAVRPLEPIWPNPNRSRGRTGTSKSAQIEPGKPLSGLPKMAE